MNPSSCLLRLGACLSLTLLLCAQAATFTVPREKISLICTDSHFKVDRVDFALPDEDYGQCQLRPLALRERWPGRRTFFIIPRVSATLLVRGDKGKSQWLPLAPLVNPGGDPLHLALDSASYDHLELVGRFGKLSDLAGKRTPDTLGAGGKLTVCASPLQAGEAPCATFDLTARFKIYRR
ncbi:hypothetical protein GCM10022631_18810 [Deinococcus rubellus]|uniref:Uncharacterized protein n=1 Tax=Deinococcus rubellus TaxID=1889240 RepID=A0ABY5YF31_9DEIO|nr:hypothetical protein [Deinococcus rubellus]UWX63677.1 hypothetical protein N0D28_13210 [Deinococcus rubellus]